MKNMRVIMVCTSTSKIISPIRSRCFLVRVSSPSTENVTELLQQVAKKEKFELPNTFALKVADQSGGNLRKALLLLECAKNQQYPFTQTQNLVVPDWEAFIKDVAKSIVEEQTPARLVIVRAKLYELLSHCIPADVILTTLVEELIAVCDDSILKEVIDIAGEYVFIKHLNITKGASHAKRC